MNLLQLQERLANRTGFARVKLRLVEHAAGDGDVELTCVETSIDDSGEVIVLSNEASVEAG